MVGGGRGRDDLRRRQLACGLERAELAFTSVGQNASEESEATGRRCGGIAKRHLRVGLGSGVSASAAVDFFP